MVGVGDRAHDRAHVERLLAAGVRLVGEDLADRAQVRVRRLVRRGADVAVDRVGGLRPAREALARGDVGALVVGEQRLAGAGEVGRPVLRLPVRAHHALVAADAEVVLRRHAARVVERLLAGQHHRALGRHHEDALGVHEHRRLGVEVRLGADVDAADDDVDLAARLRELDDPPQRRRDPVHVLRAGVHRDLRAGGEREPLDRHAQLLGEVERGDHAPALRLGERAERARRVAAAAPRAASPRGSARVRLRTSPTTMLARLVAGGRSTGTSCPSSSRSCSVKSPGGIAEPGCARCGASTLTISAGMQAAAAARGDDPLGALVERLQRLGRRVADLDGDAAAGRAEDAQRAVALDAVLAHAGADLDHLEAEPGARAREAADDLAAPPRGRSPSSARRRAAAGSRAAARGPAGATGRCASPRSASRTMRSSSGSAVMRPCSSRTGVRSRTSASATSRSSRAFSRRDRAEQVDVVRRGQPLERRTRAAATRPSARRSSGAGRGRSGSSAKRAVAVAQRRCARRGALVRRARTNTTRTTASGELRVREQRVEVAGLRAQGVEVGEHRLAVGHRAGVRRERAQRRGQLGRLAERGGDVVAAARRARSTRARTGRRRRSASRVPSSGRIR